MVIRRRRGSGGRKEEEENRVISYEGDRSRKINVQAKRELTSNEGGQRGGRRRG